MKITKKIVLATLVGVCVFGSFAHSFVNAEITQLPLATPAIEEPESVKSEQGVNGEIQTAVDVVEPVYIETILYEPDVVKKYEAVNNRGQYLVHLTFDFANTDNYGTDVIRQKLSDLLGDDIADRYVTDKTFTELTNTQRGEKVPFSDKYPLDRDCGLYRDGDECIYIRIALARGDMPEFRDLYIKQDTEILYLSEDEYNKLVESELCCDVFKYKDEISETRYMDGKPLPIVKYSILPVLYCSMQSQEVFEREYNEKYAPSNGKTVGYYALWYNVYVKPYIAE